MNARAPRFIEPRVTMAHGAGGKASRSLVESLVAPLLGPGDSLDDAATFSVDGPLAITTDSFVVKPLRFPGGSIGELAVNGTVNDLAMAGARPFALALALVLEEDLPREDLEAEVAAIARASRAAGVRILCGDTKVVERGHADGMFVTTTGIGRVDGRASLSPRSVVPGDRVLVSGPIGLHGTAMLLARGEFEMDVAVESDTRSLWPAVDALLDACGASLHALRDATRGGVASVLNEIALAARTSILVRERAVPVPPAVTSALRLLGIDPMYVANEGKLLAFVAPEASERALDALRSVAGCEEAAEIGEVVASPAGLVLLETVTGGRRVLDMLVGDIAGARGLLEENSR